MSEAPSTSAAAAAKRRLRRIPEESRKRSAQSCDLCRKRRCKCVPAPSGNGCVACRSQNIECSYTLPRKTRFYGSLDDLSDRYKCLEAIVRGAFPNDAITTAADLMQLGQRMGYTMPDMSQHSPEDTQTVLGELVKGPDAVGRSARGMSDSTSVSASASAPPPTPTSATLSTVEESPVTTVRPDDGPCADEPLGLIRDTTGREHYIGPSGGLQFLGQLRRLLISRDQESGGDTSPGSSKFTKDDTAQALETDGQQQNDDVVDPGSVSTAEFMPQDGQSPGSINSSIAKDFTKQPYDDPEELLKQLPPRETLDLLLQSFFKHVHEDFPLFHRGTFEEEYESFVVRSRQRRHRQSLGVGVMSPEPQPEFGWIGCLHMMIVFGSMSDHSIRPLDHHGLRRHCVSLTRSLLPQFVSRCTLSNVRALLLLSLFLHNNHERNAAWNLVGTATRVSFALGLHRKDTGASFRPIEREVRNRVMCTLHCFENFLASSLGRPSGLNDSDVEISPPRQGVLSGGHDGHDELIALSLKLQKILAQARVSQAVRAIRGTRSDSQSLENSARATLETLRQWKAEVTKQQSLNIPSINEAEDDALKERDVRSMQFHELKVLLEWQNPSRLRAILVLHMQYRYIAILVTRQFLFRDVLLARSAAKQNRTAPPSSSPSQVPAPLSEICVRHATQLTRIVLLLNSFNLVNGISAMDVFYAYCAGLVLILRSLRQAQGTQGSGTPPVPASVPATGNSQANQLSQEAKLQDDLRGLVGRLRDIILKVGKSGSMKRFARVMAAFEESAYHTPPSRSEDAPEETERRRRNVSGNIHRVHFATRSPMQTGSNMMGIGLLDSMLPPPQMFNSQTGEGGLPLVAGEMWQQNGLATFEGTPDLNMLIGPFLDMGAGGVGVGTDHPMADWDVEGFLSNFAPPP